jgi:hypothetical protein
MKSFRAELMTATLRVMLAWRTGSGDSECEGGRRDDRLGESR